MFPGFQLRVFLAAYHAHPSALARVQVCDAAGTADAAAAAAAAADAFSLLEKSDLIAR